MSSTDNEESLAIYESKALAVVSPFVEAELFCGVVLVAYRGEPIFREAFGLANREWTIANTPDTKFRIGSITKQFTAAAILLLAERGKLDVMDRVSVHYPGAPESWRDVTIHHLLTHTSGIPSYTSLPDFSEQIDLVEHTPDQILGLVRDLPLEFPAGERFAYNNSGYALLGWLTEHISGQSYAAFLQGAFFDSLSMHNTGYDQTLSILPQRAAGYARADGQWKNASYIAMTLPYAAGGLYSTVDDLLCWINALSHGRVINQNSLDKMLRDYGDEYGYGWVVSNQLDRRLWRHGGDINGFLGSLEQYPDDELTVIVLSNLQTANVRLIAERLAAVHFGLYEPHAETPLADASLVEYTGCYQLGPKYFVRTYLHKGALYIRTTGHEPFRLAYAGDDTFFCHVREIEVGFQRGLEGKVDAVLDCQHGARILAHRVDETQAQRTETAPLKTNDDMSSVTQDFASYVGRYRLDSVMDLDVTLDEDRIFVQGKGEEKVEMLPDGTHRFVLEEPATVIAFELDGDDVVCSLTLKQSESGSDIRAFKLNQGSR